MPVSQCEVILALALRLAAVVVVGAALAQQAPRSLPAFALPENELRSLADWVRSLNAAAFDAQPDGDAAAGERFFFGKGECANCHTAMGRGKSIGPDLSPLGRQLTLPEISRKLKTPGAQVADSYTTVTVARRQAP